MWQQLVTPDTSVTGEAGWCLYFARRVFGAPGGPNSATEAADATTLQHADQNFPPVAVPVWFDYWATLDSSGYRNWGHVVAWIPGQGFLSSPFNGYGQQWLDSVEAVERGYNCTFRFWTEDINSLQVARWVDDPLPAKRYNKDMVLVQNNGQYWVLGYGSCTKIFAPAAVVASRLFGPSTIINKQDNWERALRVCSVPVNIPAKLLADEVNDSWSFQRGFFQSRTEA